MTHVFIEKFLHRPLSLTRFAPSDHSTTEDAMPKAFLIWSTIGLAACQAVPQNSGNSPDATPVGLAASDGPLVACLQDSDCERNNYCAQINGDSFCAFDCS